VTFAGPFERSDASRIYRELDVLIVPSLWPENAPIVLQELLERGRASPSAKNSIGSDTRLPNFAVSLPACANRGAGVSLLRSERSPVGFAENADDRPTACPAAVVGDS
jgi:glycosyltransferase involved in cell wall biosynthesis